MEMEHIFTKGAHQQFGVLKTRWYARDFKLSFPDNLSQEAEANIDVLRVLRSQSVNPHRNRTCCCHKKAQSSNLKHQGEETLHTSAISTYPASPEESVVHVCVLEIRCMAASPHITTPPEA